MGSPVNGYPIGHEVDGEHHMPVLTRYCPDTLPSDLIAFNDLGRSSEAKNSSLHFFKEDRFFAHVVSEPGQFTLTASQFHSVIIPDISLSPEMPKWKRIEHTVMARMCGAVWGSQGVEVIPNLRWTGPEDYEFVAAGLKDCKLVATSTYGMQRSREGMRNFYEGIEFFINNLKPNNLIVYGNAPDLRVFWPASETRVTFFKPNATFKSMKSVSIETSETAAVALFD